ncbi:MAG: sigma-70 family RNA polymerase sigma factor [Phycisphaerales bacterium]|nr:sigma-70 family RNA polymerase sigma factor [Phycisphaerales bacterium]MCI0631559.1 sigma-70 family RNA polymerase sigma factor [Phycisphaerales bacterium]MCI0676819.1 sigma-70 family RNA polymerase sigma factor [Phycisphaerales bacterium]
MPRRQQTAQTPPRAIRKSSASRPSDEQLIQACVAGDEIAWRDLVQRYASLVYSVPIRCRMDESSADDVFQMVFEVLLKQLPQLRDHRTLSKWLLTTTQRISWRVLNKSKRQLRDFPPPHDLESADEFAHRWERQERVREALQQLGGRCQELLTMLYLDSDSTTYEQIASRLDLAVGSIGPMRARCIEKLVELLSDLRDE